MYRKTKFQRKLLLFGYTELNRRFFAPSHTFDQNTLSALKNETPIRIISDTIAMFIKEGVFWFIPQQSGVVRWLPYKTVSVCYHPNTTKDDDYIRLESFIIACNSFLGIAGFQQL